MYNICMNICKIPFKPLESPKYSESSSPKLDHMFLFILKQADLTGYLKYLFVLPLYTSVIEHIITYSLPIIG